MKTYHAKPGEVEREWVPVSYTHLDVYKRQSPPSSRLSQTAKFRSTFPSAGVGAMRGRPPSPRAGLTQSPESDVYKRQELDYAAFFPDRYDDPRYQVPEIILVWGKNPLYSSPDGFFGHSIIDLKKRGSHFIVVDPRVTWIATRADYHLQLRPGTDAAVGLGPVSYTHLDVYKRQVFMQYAFGAVAWDYTGMWLSIGGRTLSLIHISCDRGSPQMSRFDVTFEVTPCHIHARCAIMSCYAQRRERVLMAGIDIKPDAQGKVRDLYDLGDKLLLVATDRISAFDYILEDEIPYKGQVLTQLSTFWFELLGDVVDNHLISTDAVSYTHLRTRPSTRTWSSTCARRWG